MHTNTRKIDFCVILLKFMIFNHLSKNKKFWVVPPIWVVKNIYMTEIFMAFGLLKHQFYPRLNCESKPKKTRGFS